MIYSHSVTVTATATTISANSTSYIQGSVVAVEYIKGGTAFSATADLDITTLGTSHTILGSLAIGSDSFIKGVSLSVVNTTNSAVSNVVVPVPVADERFKVNISKTTATGQSGTFVLYEER